MKEKREKINHLKDLIKSMKSDGECFGLVSEDYAKISEWENQIKELEGNNEN